MGKLILDACCNHLGNNSIIFKMIDIADKYADYIKFQLYDSDKLNHDYPNYQEVRDRMYAAELHLLDVKRILEYCGPLGIVAMFTIMHEGRIEWLVKNYNMKFAIKVASPDMGNQDLILKLVKAFPDREIIVSCGMHDIIEIDTIRDTFSKYNNVKFLYCVSMYPTPMDMVNYELLKKFDGFSDHTVGLSVLRHMLERGISPQYYEKHFTLSKDLPVVDRDWAVTPEDLPYIRAYLDKGTDEQKYKSRWVK